MSNLGGSLAPGFLIASPPLGDPNFDRTVVLLAIHGETGALGFVVNRAAPMSLGELLGFAGYSEKKLEDEAIHGQSSAASSHEQSASAASMVYVGGPVQPSSGWILCVDPALPADDTGVIAVGDRVRVTSSRTAFDELAADVAKGVVGPADPKRRIVLLGYSGWAPGQLEGEIAAGAWLPVPLDEEVLFDVALADRWEAAYKLLGLTPAVMMTMRSAGEA